MFRKLQNNKIGNTLIYLSERVSNLYLTKAIKLLYLIDEFSIRETGVPVTWLEYKAWENGPVPPVLHDNLRYDIKETHKGEVVSFDQYIDVEVIDNPVNDSQSSYVLHPKMNFNDDEFTDYEIDLFDRIIRKYGGYTAKRLINLLHEKGTLWTKAVNDNNLQLQFLLQNKKSDFSINFTKLLEGDDLKLEAYRAAYESMDFQENLSTC